MSLIAFLFILFSFAMRPTLEINKLSQESANKKTQKWQDQITVNGWLQHGDLNLFQLYATLLFTLTQANFNTDQIRNSQPWKSFSLNVKLNDLWRCKSQEQWRHPHLTPGGNRDFNCFFHFIILTHPSVCHRAEPDHIWGRETRAVVSLKREECLKISPFLWTLDHQVFFSPGQVQRPRLRVKRMLRESHKTVSPCECSDT